MVFRVGSGEVLYSDMTYKIVANSDVIPSVDYESLYDKFEKDQLSFNLYHLYIKIFY